MIQIRPYRADDYNFIVSSWSKSAYEYSSGKMEKFSIYHDGIKDLFDRKMKDEIGRASCRERVFEAV